MKVFVNYNDKRWKKYNINFEKIANAVVGAKYKDSEVSITLIDDEEIHALNKMYRNIDKPTNVLSFELGDDILLGDIYISLDTVVREAAEAKISVEEHVAHMVVHGMFHLLGYDHLTDAQARRLGIRAKGEDGNYLVHTLNNTVLATPRGLIAFLENNVNEDGSVNIPVALRPYMGGIEKIVPKK